jgi:hypothetical protein
MKQTAIKTIFMLLILAGVVCLTTGIDQYMHILVCHHESHFHTKLPTDKSSHQSDSDEQHCPICQFFICGQNQSVVCDCFQVAIDPAPALSGIPGHTFVFITAPVFCKICRAPPTV